MVSSLLSPHHNEIVDHTQKDVQATTWYLRLKSG